MLNVVKICQSVAEILQVFEFSRWPLPPYLIFEMRKFCWLTGSRKPRLMSVPNFVKIGQSVAKILRVFNFSRWQPPQSCIVEFAKFYWLMVSYGPRQITVPNFIKIVAPLQRYCDFSNLQDGRRRHLVFLKLRNFIGYWIQRVETHQCAKFRQNWSIGCKDIKIFRFFMMAAAAIFDFRNRQILFADGI